MNILNETIHRSYPGAELSCRECGSNDVVAQEDNSVSMANPHGERMMRIKCKSCGLADEATNPRDVRETVKAWLINTVRLYTCTYIFKGREYETSADKGIEEFTDGFWVNVRLAFTKGSDCMYWIPPGKIERVKVETVVKRLSE